MTKACPLCAFDEFDMILRERSRATYRCHRCDLRFIEPSARVSAFDEKARYLLHNNDPGDPGYRDFVRPLIDQITSRVAVGASVLDFGAGTGPVLAAMLKEAGYAVTLFDPFFHPDRKCLETKYDLIVACEVAEHFHDPFAEFSLLRTLLAEGGILGLMTFLWNPTIDFARWSYRRDPTHVVFYSEATFRWIRDRFGFASVEFPTSRVILLSPPSAAREKKRQSPPAGSR